MTNQNPCATKLEKIILGDDRIDFAKQNFPAIPNSQVEFVDNFQELIDKAKQSKYDMVITDLDYTYRGAEGFRVLEELRDNPARKILWTGRGSDPEVRMKGKALGAEVLDKDELGSIVGQAVNRAPLKQGGDVLVYIPEGRGSAYRALRQVLETVCNNSRFVISSNLKQELETGKYGMVIDTTTMGGDSRNGVVAHDLKYLHLNEAPRVVCVNSVPTILATIVGHAGEYLAQDEQGEAR